MAGELETVTGGKIVTAEFQHAPCLGILEHRVVRGIGEPNEFIQNPAALALGISPRHDRLTRHGAVQKPMFSGPNTHGMAPHQVSSSEANVGDVAPFSGEINRTA
jgi:hypothetical protein